MLFTNVQKCQFRFLMIPILPRLLLFVEWWHQNLTFWQTEALYLLFGSSLVNILVAYPINIWLDGLGRFNIDVFQFRFLNMKNNSKINRRNFFYIGTSLHLLPIDQSYHLLWLVAKFQLCRCYQWKLGVMWRSHQVIIYY